MYKLLSVSSIVLALSSVPALAVDAACAPPSFATLDADGDGGISSAELDAYHSSCRPPDAPQGRRMQSAAKSPMFDTLDADGDGRITETEWNDRPHGPHGAHGAGGPPSFAELDSDGDGTVSEDEFINAMPPGAKSAAPSETGPAAQMFERLDSDGNGQLSEAEFSAKPQRRP